MISEFIQTPTFMQINFQIKEILAAEEILLFMVIHAQCLIQNPKLQSYLSTKKVLLKPKFSDVISS